MTTSVLFADAIARAVAGWLLTYAIHSTILLGLAALLAVRLREQHAWLDWMWKVALLGAVATATVQSGLRLQPLGGRWSPFPASSAAEDGSAARPARQTESAGEARARDTESTRAHAGAACCATDAAPARDAGASVTAFTGEAAKFLEATWSGLLVGSWVLLALMGLARLGWRQRALYRVLAGRRPVLDVRLTHALGALSEAAGLRRSLRLTVTPRCPVPVAMLRGEIVVPERFLTELDAEQQRAALAHEVAHQMRHDPVWLLLVHVLEAVFFFQPLQRRARRALRDGAEVLCDDWAVRQTVSIGVARCLAAVATWISPAREWQMTAASGMACSDCALLRRVDRVLRSERVRPTRRVVSVATLLLLPLLLLIAPVVSSADIPVSATPLRRLPLVPPAPTRGDAGAQTALAAQRPPASVAVQERVVRAPRPGDPLEERWSWALEEAGRRRLRGFYVVYSFYRPVTRDQQYISDSHGVNFSEQLFRMTPLRTVLDGASPIGGRGTIGAIFHFTAADDRRIDRIGHRSMTLGYDFEGETVFWLGYADEAESLRRLGGVFGSVAPPALRGEVVEAYGLHPTTDRVLPFLTRVLAAEMHAEVRAEAAESLEHHADTRVVPLLVRTARSDASVAVRAEAAEALGEVDVPAAIPALVELAKNAADAQVRMEAAEALGEQSPDRALRALEQVIDESTDAHVRIEAVEALGTLHTRQALDALVRLIWQHRSPDVQRKAVETLGDYEDLGIVAHLEKILVEHDDAQTVLEALDVLGRLHDPRAQQRIAVVARTSRSAHARREALQLLGEAQERGDERAGGFTTEQFAALLERVIFEDSDRSVQLEALDVAAESLPRAAARRLLRRVADEHPVRSIRQEAFELLEDLR